MPAVRVHDRQAAFQQGEPGERGVGIGRQRGAALAERAGRQREAGGCLCLELRDLDAAAAGAIHAVEVLQVAVVVDDADDNGKALGAGGTFCGIGHAPCSLGCDLLRGGRRVNIVCRRRYGGLKEHRSANQESGQKVLDAHAREPRPCVAR